MEPARLSLACLIFLYRLGGHAGTVGGDPLVWSKLYTVNYNHSSLYTVILIEFSEECRITPPVPRIIPS